MRISLVLSPFRAVLFFLNYTAASVAASCRMLFPPVTEQVSQMVLLSTHLTTSHEVCVEVVDIEEEADQAWQGSLRHTSVDADPVRFHTADLHSLLAMPAECCQPLDNEVWEAQTGQLPHQYIVVNSVECLAKIQPQDTDHVSATRCV